LRRDMAHGKWPRHLCFHMLHEPNVEAYCLLNSKELQNANTADMQP